MPPTPMRKAVLQATLIFLISMIIEHYVNEDMHSKVLQNSAFRELHDEILRVLFPEPVDYSLAPTANATDNRANSTANSTANGTNSISEFIGLVDDLQDMQRVKIIFGKVNHNTASFFGRELPRETVIFVIITILRYQWFFWLEKSFPARSRSTGSLSRQDKKSEAEDGLSQKRVEMLHTWNTRGRIQRQSLNKRNTLWKWVVECTFGTGWCLVFGHIIRLLLHLESPQTILKGLPSQIFYGLLANFLSCSPWAVLLAFIAIPVHSQVVFVTTAESIGTLFLKKLFSLGAVWYVERDATQEWLRKMAETARGQADLLRHDEI